MIIAGSRGNIWVVEITRKYPSTFFRVETVDKIWVIWIVHWDKKAISNGKNCLTLNSLRVFKVCFESYESYCKISIQGYIYCKKVGHVNRPYQS